MIGKFHHLGFATKSINQEVSTFENLGYTLEGDYFEDSDQGIRGVFMIGAGPRIELLENISGCNTLTPWIEKGVQIYHQAYFVQDIEKTVLQSRLDGNYVVVKPIESIAFEGRRISFVIMKNRMLLEFIEE